MATSRALHPVAEAEPPAVGIYRPHRMVEL